MFKLFSRLCPRCPSISLVSRAKQSSYCAGTAAQAFEDTTSNNGRLLDIFDTNHDLTDDQLMLRDQVGRFAAAELRPNMAEWDRNYHFPKDVLRRGAQLGLGGLFVPADFGGAGLSRLDSSLAIETLATGCSSTAAYVALHNMVAWLVARFGSDQQRDEVLPDLVTMDRFGSYCLTEPWSGSDAASLKMRADRTGDYYVLNGSKAFISGADPDNWFLVLARTGGCGPKGISCLIVDGRTEGVSLGAHERKLGWRSHPTRAVNFDDVRVPATNLLGQEGQGFVMAMQGINGTRINMGSCSVGAATRALEDTIQYVKDRKQFGRPISAFQNTQFKIAQMATDLVAARLVVRAAARSADVDLVKAAPAAATAKFVASRKAQDIIDQCLQLHGGYGYLEDFPMQQLLRDNRCHMIIGGTNEIMQLIIARKLIGGRCL